MPVELGLRAYLRRVVLAVVGGLAFYVLFVKLVELKLSIAGVEDLSILVAGLVLRVYSLLTQPIEVFYALRLLEPEKRVKFRDLVIHINGAIALEYLIPVGGAAEAYKFLALYAEGSDPCKVAVAIFVQRLAMSSALIIVFAATIQSSRIDSYSVFAAIVLILLEVTNVVGLFFASSRFFEEFLKRAEKIFKHRIVEGCSAGRAELKREMFALGVVTAIAVAEVLLAVETTDTVFRAFGFKLGRSCILRCFIVSESIVWLLPLITPGNVGTLESIQVAILMQQGFREYAAAAPLIYRLSLVIPCVPIRVVTLLLSLNRISKQQKE